MCPTKVPLRGTSISRCLPPSYDLEFCNTIKSTASRRSAPFLIPAIIELNIITQAEELKTLMGH